jgi:hypothetical protein
VPNKLPNIRRAKTRLPAEIKKKLEEWNFTSGALVMCLVAYSDGKQVQGFQLVLLSTPNDNLLNLFTVSRVLTMSEIRLPIPARNGRRGHTKTLKIGQ